MTTAATSLPPLHPAVDGWQLEVLGRAPGSTRVTYGRDDIQVRIADATLPALGGVGSLRSLLAVQLGRDGTAHVTTRCAPPALVVSSDGIRPLPADGSTSATTRLQPGDLLVMCSAAALDAHPAGVVALLAAEPDSVRDRDPASVAGTLLRGSLVGSAAVVRRVGRVPRQEAAGELVAVPGSALRRTTPGASSGA